VTLIMLLEHLSVCEAVGDLAACTNRRLARPNVSPVCVFGSRTSHDALIERIPIPKGVQESREGQALEQLPHAGLFDVLVRTALYIQLG